MRPPTKSKTVSRKQLHNLHGLTHPQGLKQVLGNQNSNLGDVEERLKQNEDQIKHINDTIDGLHKTVAIFEGRYVETVEKMKEVPVLASNIQVQVSGQAQKVVESTAPVSIHHYFPSISRQSCVFVNETA